MKHALTEAALGTKTNRRKKLSIQGCRRRDRF
jgi:hypothetical protein